MHYFIVYTIHMHTYIDILYMHVLHEYYILYSTHTLFIYIHIYLIHMYIGESRGEVRFIVRPSRNR